jgi:hypothetical protein
MQLGRCDQQSAQWFLKRGFAVLFALRRGYGATGGVISLDIQSFTRASMT